MADRDTDTVADTGAVEPAWRWACAMSGVAAFLMLVAALVTMVVFVTLGAEPATPAEYFELLAKNRLVGLLRMDLASLATVGLYYFLFFGLYAALRDRQGPLATFSTALGFAGVTLWFANHSAMSMVTLGDRFARAATSAERERLTAAAEAVLASDVWHSTGTAVGGLLLLGAGVLVSVAMLRSGLFGKVAAFSGVLANGLDLLHILINMVAGGNQGDILMAVAGPCYLVWFVLLGRRLLALGQTGQTQPAGDAGSPLR
jgi:hypothetical protein